MRLRLYSIKDRLSGVYLTPFPARADIDAIRQMLSSLNNPELKDTPLNVHRDDFELVYLATMEDETGEIFSEAHAGGLASFSLGTISALVLRSRASQLDVPYADPSSSS